MGDEGTVLLCHDGSEDSSRALREAAALLGPRPAVVLSVWEPARDLTPLDLVGDAIGRLSGLYADLDEAGLELAREIATSGVAIARAAGFDARPRAECGRPAATIVRVADELGAQVIVLGARGRSGAARLGSVSGRVCRHAHRPVLVLPRAG